ncbi:MAG TPA: carbamoyltransferase N-terminal domain-containing protein, partial [Bryobacteraceae bacterium]|nr:carbamoyltransferase N-terminal domain-containing protein [Bryobacteraceae bacterium]
FHDAAAALLVDGVLAAAAEEERFSRRKHDASFPRHAIEFCLRQAGLRRADLDVVAYFEKPFLKLERLLISALRTWPKSRGLFSESMLSFAGDKLWIRRLIEEELGVAAHSILFCEHHLSHAASCFLVSPFREAAILTIDGVGEWTTTSIGLGRENRIQILDEIRFPHSLGLLYSAFTAFLGFEVNEGEYKVMGMAAFGRPRFVDEVRRLIRLDADGSFELDLSYFSFPHSTHRTYNQKFEQLFGEARSPGSSFDPDSPASRRHADIAASVQNVLEEAILRLARRARERTGINRLCLAGGVALNSVANGRLLREAGFDDIYIQPAAGDSGGALGAALYAWHIVENRPRAAVLDRADLGEAWPDAASCLDSAGVGYRRLADSSLIDQVAAMLASGKVVAWFQGRFEWGPRSLGQRSILADPRKAEMRDHVNLAVKFREPFRPFAPSVVAERAKEYFNLPDAGHCYPARFMLYVIPVHGRQRPALGAVTHVDGTARPQVVHRECHPLFYTLLSRFEEYSGVPVLLNTSFNVQGEPIVASPSDALSTFQRSNLDALVLNDCLIDKQR